MVQTKVTGDGLWGGSRAFQGLCHSCLSSGPTLSAAKKQPPKSPFSLFILSLPLPCTCIPLET